MKIIRAGSRKHLFFIFFLVLLIFLGASGTTFLIFKQWNRPVEKLRVIQDKHSVYYLPQYVALEMGFFKEEKLNIEIITAVAESALPLALDSGRAQIILCGLEQAIYARADKRNVIVFAALAKRDSSFLVAREKNTPFQWAGLKEKRVITGPPGSRHTVLLKGILKKYGLTPNHQVTLFTNIPASIQAGAFKSGTGDYIVLDEPQATLFERKKLGSVVASLGEEAGEFPAGVFTADEEFIRTHPETIQHFTNAIHKALFWLQNHTPAEAAQTVQQHYQSLESEVLVKSIERYYSQGTWPTSALIKEAGYYRFLKYLLDAREIPRPVSYLEIADNRFAKEAEESVNLLH